MGIFGKSEPVDMRGCGCGTNCDVNTAGMKSVPSNPFEGENKMLRAEIALANEIIRTYENREQRDAEIERFMMENFGPPVEQEEVVIEGEMCHSCGGLFSIDYLQPVLDIDPEDAEQTIYFCDAHKVKWDVRRRSNAFSWIQKTNTYFKTSVEVDEDGNFEGYVTCEEADQLADERVQEALGDRPATTRSRR